jgi:ubiquinone/menaquinone biosynthesis C-methylase UbiE
MFSESADYHRLELSIATNPHDSRRVMPCVEPKHRRILDVGCGAGQTLIGCNLNDAVFAVGIDADHSAVALGKEFSSSIHFVTGRGEALPFRNACFDLVICRIALPYMHVSMALAEISRVTAAGGDVWLALHPLSMTAKELGTNIVRFQLKAGIYRLWVLMNGLGLHLFGRQWHWPGNSRRLETWQSDKGMKRALKAAGFDQIRITRENHFVVTATKGHEEAQKDV